MSTPTQKPAANREIKIFPDVNAIAKRAAELIVESAASAVAQNGRFTISLAGGSTPKTLYALLAAEPHRSKMPWDKTYLFFGDERHVPPDDPDSNYRMAKESLISKLSLKPDQIHRIHCENPVEKAAQDYEQDLRTFFKLAPGQLPASTSSSLAWAMKATCFRSSRAPRLFKIMVASCCQTGSASCTLNV